MLERLREMLRSAAVGKVLAMNDVARSPTGRTHRPSMRLIATTLRAEFFVAKQGDDATARTAIQDGLALWEELKGRPGGPGLQSTEHFQSWERWARGWLARSPPP